MAVFSETLTADLGFIIVSCKQRRSHNPERQWHLIPFISVPLVVPGVAPFFPHCVLPLLFYFPITSPFVSVSVIAAMPYADRRLLLVWSCILFNVASDCVRSTRYSDTALRVGVFVFNTQSPPPSLIWSRAYKDVYGVILVGGDARRCVGLERKCASTSVFCLSEGGDSTRVDFLERWTFCFLLLWQLEMMGNMPMHSFVLC